MLSTLLPPVDREVLTGELRHRIYAKLTSTVRRDRHRRLARRRPRLLKPWGFELGRHPASPSSSGRASRT